jgi:hypothetical protein
MDDETQHQVDTLWNAELIVFGTPAKSCGNAALLTFEGSARLAEWSAAWPKDGAA